MGYKVNIDGVEVLCETADEAIRLARGVSANGKKHVVEVNETVQVHTFVQTRSQDAEPVVRFLRLLKSGTRITANDIVREFKLKGPRGVGGLLVGFAGTIQKAELDPQTVFRRRGDPGRRFWSGGPGLDAALAKIDAH